jgi:putative flippase GtrA
MGSGFASKYVLFGTGNAIFGYLVYVYLVWLLYPEISISVIFVLSTIISIAESFAIHKIYIWKTETDWRPEAIRFFTTYTFVSLINLILLHLLMGLSSADPRLIQLPILFCLALMLYLVNKKWIFKV